MNNIINNWVKDRKKNILFIYGDIYNAPLDSTELSKNYNVRNLYPHDFINKNEIIDRIKKIKSYRDFFAPNVPKMLIINEINNILSKSLINKIIQGHLKDRKILVVLTGYGKCYKNIKDLGRYIELVKVETTKKVKTNIDIIDKLLTKHNIKMEVQLKKYIMKNCNNIESRIQNILMLIKDDTNNKKYKLKDYKDTLGILFEKLNIDIELFDICNNIFSDKEVTVNDIINFYNMEKMFLPLTIHYNYHSYLLNKFNKKDEILDNFEKVSNMLSKSEKLHHYMFNKHFWDLNVSFCILSCYYPSMLLKDNLNKKTELKFTNIMSKDSSKFIKHYNYYNLIAKLKTNLIDKELIEFNFKKMLLKLFSDDIHLINEGVKELHERNATIKDLNKMIKISKEFWCLEKFTNKKKTQLTKIWKKIN